MDSRRAGWSLRVFLALVVVLLAWGLGRQVGRPPFDDVLAQVVDGDLDRDARLAALRILRDQGVDGPGRTLVAAMAALVLNDSQAFEAAAGRLAPLLVDFPGGEVWLDRAALGEPCLQSLLAALSAESLGESDEAGVLFARAERCASLWRIPLAEQLAAEGLRRLR